MNGCEWKNKIIRFRAGEILNQWSLHQHIWHHYSLATSLFWTRPSVLLSHLLMVSGSSDTILSMWCLPQIFSLIPSLPIQSFHLLVKTKFFFSSFLPTDFSSVWWRLSFVLCLVIHFIPPLNNFPLFNKKKNQSSHAMIPHFLDFQPYLSLVVVVLFLWPNIKR